MNEKPPAEAHVPDINRREDVMCYFQTNENNIDIEPVGQTVAVTEVVILLPVRLFNYYD